MEKSTKYAWANKRMLKCIRVLVWIVWIVTFILAVLWTLEPENSQYEPITVILGLVSVAISAVLVRMTNWVMEKQRTVYLPTNIGDDILLEHKQILRNLNDKSVEYVLIGGFTGIFYGRVRHTHDLDVWIGYSSKNHKKLKVAIQSLGYKASQAYSVGVKTSRMTIRLGKAPIDLYFNKSMNGTDFYAFYKRRKVFVVDNLPISVMAHQDNRVQTSYKFDSPKL